MKNLTRSAGLLLTLFGVLLASSPLAADESGQMPKHKITQSESYIMLEPMYATIMDGDKPAGTLMVAIGLDIPDARLRADAERALPILRDDYIRSVMSFAWTSVRITEQADVIALADRLQRVTDRALHRPGARVLLAQVASKVTF